MKLKKRNIKFLILALITFLLISCAGRNEKPTLQVRDEVKTGAAGQVDNGKYILKVVLYPYIPVGPSGSLQPMANRIESEFEGENPSIDLQILPIGYENDPYTTENLTKWLGAPVSDSGVHIVELDAVMLGFVTENSLVMPQDPSGFASDFHPAALSAVRIGDTSYGVPHWMCGNFIISPVEAITQSQNLDVLGKLLRENKDDSPYLSGNFRGSWTLPSLYLGAWACTYGPSNLQDALTGPLDAAVVGLLNTAASLCTDEASANPCIDFTYKDNTQSMSDFAKGEYDGFIGFSESMNTIAQQGVSSSDYYIGNFPFGNDNEQAYSLYYSDVFVIRQDCEGDCITATTAFIRYMIKLDTFKWIVKTEDSSTPAIPRYVIPSREGVFDLPDIQADQYYQRIKVAIYSGSNTNFPNTGVLENNDRLNEELTNRLNWPTKNK
ncbi:MAG: hypothetical protein KAW12_24590 [Candidatus Aminicenantes bacterium]|nr:hypothetical protein [Candidatus Aminicenantes bacterium]